MIRLSYQFTFKLFFLRKFVLNSFIYAISYNFNVANAREKGSKMLEEWYYNGWPQNIPKGNEVQSWILLPQHEYGYSVVEADS